MNKISKSVVMMLAGLLPVSARSQSVPDPLSWDRAEREIRRLTPMHFRSMPRPITRYLLRNGYSIPQVYDDDSPHNVIRGQFDGDGVTDVAVLASRGGSSRILVFWGSTAARVSQLRRLSDATYLQNVGKGKIGYSRRIDAVDGKHIGGHGLTRDGSKPPPIRHQAIEDWFDGKGSELLYYDGRRWHTLPGAD